MSVIWAIVAIWAIVIPVIVVLVCWDAARRREAWAADVRRALLINRQPGVPACAVRPARPSRTTTRRICPHLAGRVRRRPASA